mmetsp:Transcript_20278/g.45827  ORF Transcript_20278/g.45827 Transcript_20278/m.45827 type:complete len:414 (-) Transcript_20278:381-1622(-)
MVGNRRRRRGLGRLGLGRLGGFGGFWLFWGVCLFGSFGLAPGLLLGGLGSIDPRGLDEGEEIHAAHEGPKRLGDHHPVGRLVVLQQAANTAARGAERGVEHVDVRGRGLAHLLGPAADAHGPRLEVGAVGRRDQLAVGLLPRKPRLQVVLLDRRVVEPLGADGDDAVGETEGVVKLARVLEHLLLHPHRRLQVILANHELLHLFELVDPEDSADVLARAAGLLAEAGGDARVALGELLLLEPLAHVEAADGLLRGGDQVLLRRPVGVVRLARHLVELLVEVLELGDPAHEVLVHEVGRLQDLVPLVVLAELLGSQKADGVVDQGLVQQHSRVGQKVGAVARHLAPPFIVEAADAPKDLVVLEGLGRGERVLNRAQGLRQLQAGNLRAQFAHGVVQVLVVAGRDLGVDNVAEFV